MNADTTWDLLKLALSGVALGVSLLIWYLRHFSEELRAAETKSRDHRKALSRSPRILLLLAGVIIVLIASYLSASVVRDALNSNELAIPRRSHGFLLLVIIIAVPAIGAIAIAIVSLSQVGWISGTRQSLVALWQALFVRTIDLGPALLELEIVVEGRTIDDFPVSDLTLANWKTSIEWVKSNERSWGLGRGFLSKNQCSLVSVVNYEWKRRVGGEHVQDITDIDELVAVRIEEILAKLGVFQATYANRPIQIANVACTYYAESAVQGK